MFNCIGKVALTGIGVIDIIPYIYDKCMSLSKIPEYEQTKKSIRFKTNKFLWTDGSMYIAVWHNIPQLNVHANMDVNKYSLIKDNQNVDFEKIENVDFKPIELDLFEEFSTTTARDVIDLDNGKKKTLVRIGEKWFAATSVQAVVDCVRFFRKDIRDARFRLLVGSKAVILNAFVGEEQTPELFVSLLNFDVKKK